MDATLKAYIDFKDFGAQNISRKERKNRDYIARPQNNAHKQQNKIMKESSSLFLSLRRNFSDAELSLYEQQGREEESSRTFLIWKSLKQQDKMQPIF